ILDPVRHVPNPKIVGKHATVVAEIAGIKVPDATRVLIARLTPEQVGREYPLSAEKLSPVLAFFTVADTRAGIELCTRLLRFGGAGHTAAIHTQNEAVAREFGAAVPAFRVCVNTSAVHGSIGYSTNLFPAMTLGCGSPGGNITSDNIGPQHLMNVKRIAWESRRVEHRTIPAAQRLSGAGFQPAQDGSVKVAAAAAGAMAGASAAGMDDAGAQRAQRGAQAIADSKSKIQEARMATPAASVMGAPDRQLIQQIVARVFEQRGITRGGGNPVANPAPDASNSPPATVAMAASPVASSESTKGGASPAPTPAKKSEPAPVPIAAFVSEADVRRALTKGEKIYIGPKTIVTPAARDLGGEHEVLIETKPA
ncbi:MAG: hypothetical protein ACRD5W_05075, partial [Candidatus Acidiferrales bacterium]